VPGTRLTLGSESTYPPSIYVAIAAGLWGTIVSCARFVTAQNADEISAQV
jgi:hypothetical protein